MTDLERALLHIKTRADAWAVKEVEKAIELDYKAAFQIACALLNGDTLYGMDAESIFSEIMKKDGCVCSFDYEDYILTHLNELRDDKSLSQEPCDDAISRDMALEKMADYVASGYADSAEDFEEYSRIICQSPPVTQKPETGHCKECKHFEYDSVAKVDGIPLIVAHEICNKWGDGCKTSEDGYCYLFEPQESEVRNDKRKGFDISTEDSGRMQDIRRRG